jgi:hypothetical protein
MLFGIDTKDLVARDDDLLTSLNNDKLKNKSSCSRDSTPEKARNVPVSPPKDPSMHGSNINMNVCRDTERGRVSPEGIKASSSQSRTDTKNVLKSSNSMSMSSSSSDSSSGRTLTTCDRKRASSPECGKYTREVYKSGYSITSTDSEPGRTSPETMMQASSATKCGILTPNVPKTCNYSTSGNSSPEYSSMQASSTECAADTSCDAYKSGHSTSTSISSSERMAPDMVSCRSTSPHVCFHKHTVFRTSSVTSNTSTSSSASSAHEYGTLSTHEYGTLSTHEYGTLSTHEYGTLSTHEYGSGLPPGDNLISHTKNSTHIQSVSTMHTRINTSSNARATPSGTYTNNARMQTSHGRVSPEDKTAGNDKSTPATYARVQTSHGGRVSPEDKLAGGDALSRLLRPLNRGVPGASCAGGLHTSTSMLRVDVEDEKSCAGGNLLQPLQPGVCPNSRARSSSTSPESVFKREKRTAGGVCSEKMQLQLQTKRGVASRCGSRSPENVLRRDADVLGEVVGRRGSVGMAREHVMGSTEMLLWLREKSMVTLGVRRDESMLGTRREVGSEGGFGGSDACGALHKESHIAERIREARSHSMNDGQSVVISRPRSVSLE